MAPSIRSRCGAFDPVAVRRAFEREHDRQFGHIQPAGAMEITSLRVLGRGLFQPIAPRQPAPAETAPTPTEVRPVYLDERHGWSEAPVFDGARLRPGHRVDGPLLVQEQTTTVLVGAGEQLGVDAADNFVIDLPVTEEANRA